ncbi:MAG: penicillin-binding protein 1A [bacterium]
MRRTFRDDENGGSFWRRVTEFVKTRPIATTFILFFMFIFSGVIYLFIISRDLPSLQQLEDYKPKLASKVYSADMKIIHEYYEEKRSYVPLEEMPPALVKAVIATEDRTFYQHWGFNLRRFTQAIFINLISMRYKEGASTLTQQLARQLYLTLEKTISRKVKELLTAIQIEKTYTKEEILEMYLNQMNFGHGAYGAQSASLLYFGKDVRDITPAECAMLVGVLPAPSYYSPHRNRNRTLARRNVVLSSMLKLNYITEDEYAGLVQTSIEVIPYKSGRRKDIAPYFTEYIRQILYKEYGYNLFTDGLSIYTTLDTRAQFFAEAAIQNHLPKVQQKMTQVYSKKKKFVELLQMRAPEFLKENNVTEVLQDSTLVDSLIKKYAPVQTALISLDPRNGHILAWVGGRDFNESKFNRVVQARRQPGSGFKPFVYTVAIDNGYPPSYEVLNQPVVTEMPDGTRWSPRNYNPDDFGGPTTFREGLRRSLNLVTVRVLQEVIRNPRFVVEYAQKMGIKSPLVAVDALALGASDVTPLELTSAYGVFANGGIHVEPVAIMRVEDKNGNILKRNIPRRREALRKETAYIMTNLLGTVINRGTGASSRWKYHFTRPAGGKTGTTNDYGDAWFTGFTRQIATGVWVGNDDHVSLGRGSDGAKTALPIWAPYMKAVHDTLGLQELDFNMPDGVVKVEICGDTKDLATSMCPNIMEEVFFREYAPTSNCKTHLGQTREKRRKSKKRIR